MTANQLVAFNLRNAREGLGLTQEMAAQRLEPYIGKRWSVASFSDAERSADNGRTREFDANELLAFSQAFGKPIAWFFTPPADLESVDAGAPLERSRSVSRAELLKAIEGSTLWDSTVVAQLRGVVDALEEIERNRVGSEEQDREAAPSGTVGVARNVVDQELIEPSRLIERSERKDDDV